jgi:hypothetical protein
MAVSAFFSRASGTSPSAGKQAMPRLAVTDSSRPCTSMGGRTASRSLAATLVASSAWVTWCTSTANSSAASRATVSPSLTQRATLGQLAGARCRQVAERA